MYIDNIVPTILSMVCIIHNVVGNPVDQCKCYFTSPEPEVSEDTFPILKVNVFARRNGARGGGAH